VYLDYFPYPALRPYQDRMLDAVYDAVRDGGHSVLMIDAPTGCGKTSCLSAALSAAPGKVVVAVRTVSQIDIYLDEVRRIWSKTRHQPEISYLVGKQKVCPLANEFRGESVYSACSRLRDWSKNYMTSRMKKQRDSIYDPVKDQIAEEEAGCRTFCPYYIRSREAFEVNGKVYFRRSTGAVEAAEKVRHRVIPADELPKHTGGACPYEVMSLCARASQIIIMNYHHLFSPDFQDAVFEWLELDAEDLTLIVDEAHNLGDAVRSMNSRALAIRNIDLAEREVEKFEKALGQSRLEEGGSSSWRREGVKNIRILLPRLRKFLASREKRGSEGESLLDSDLFREFLYQGIPDIDMALSYFGDVAVAVAEMKLAEGDSETASGELQPSLATALLFLRDIEDAENDSSMQSRVSVSVIGNRRFARLEVVRIDPAPVVRRVVDNIHATVMLSGTFSPLEAYELYLFGEEGRARKLSLPNPFPAENRLILAASQATTQLEARDDSSNQKEIAEHIQAIIETVPGNVALFFTSYSMMSSLVPICQKSARRAAKRIFREPRLAEEVPSMLDEFFLQGRKRGGVLLGVSGGKLAEGIDYKGEALQGVAVVGLPLAVFDEIQREIINYYTRKYGRDKGMLIAYILPAINRGLQAAGRVIRAETERGVMLFCDRRFCSSGPGGVLPFLPSWVQEEMVEVDGSGTAEAIRRKQIDWQADAASCPAPRG